MRLSRWGIRLIKHDPVTDKAEFECKQCGEVWEVDVFETEAIAAADRVCPIDARHTKTRGKRYRGKPEKEEAEDDKYEQKIDKRLHPDNIGE
jgi:hypothetical protein